MQKAVPYTGAVEAYKRPDPTLPAVPAGKVKAFNIDVFEHVTKVAADQPPTRVWSYGVNGTFFRGTGASTPMVVNQGDMVRIRMHNGSSMAMHVEFPHSIDFHSSEVPPEKMFKTIGGGQTVSFTFRAKHPGVFMYHCATDPVLMHTGSGMVGMMVVKPKGLPPVDHEYWMTQQEYYIGQPGGNADMDKMSAMKPDVVAFNGYADQYKKAPIVVKAGERIRVYAMNAGPSIWSAFHVIGTVFDRTTIEGQTGHDAQTVNLAPSQGGWMDFSLDAPGDLPVPLALVRDDDQGRGGRVQGHLIAATARRSRDDGPGARAGAVRACGARRAPAPAACGQLRTRIVVRSGRPPRTARDDDEDMSSINRSPGLFVLVAFAVVYGVIAAEVWMCVTGTIAAARGRHGR